MRDPHVCTERDEAGLLLLFSLYLLNRKTKNLQGCLITFRCYPPNLFLM
eukprot:09042.XXX_407088_407234_1 [CDS] Oithona nana genome sequencing.